jgi:glycosyltransferase involved in cell wall biosynthesis
MKKISVVIPCFNEEQFILRCVNSVLEQRQIPDEVLVVDDGSTDDSMELIANLPVRIIRMGKNSGRIAAVNRGYLESKGEFIATIDADCEASPTWLEELINGLPEHCAASGGKTLEVNDKMLAGRWRARHMPLHWGDKPFENPKVVYGPNNVFRKDDLLKTGLADETKVAQDYKIGASDWELTQKFYAAGYKLYYNPRAIVYQLRSYTPAGVIRQYWRWSVFYYPEPVSWPVFFLKAGINFLKAVKHALGDVLRAELRLVPISLRIFPAHTYYDFQHLRKARQRSG